MSANLAASSGSPDARSMAAAGTAVQQTQPSDTSMQAIYRLFADISGAMLESARRGDWDDVTAREKTCAQLVEALRHRPALTPADEAERIECLHLMQKVLADDAAIRELASPWLEQLSQILRPRSGQRAVHSFR